MLGPTPTPKHFLKARPSTWKKLQCAQCALCVYGVTHLSLALALALALTPARGETHVDLLGVLVALEGAVWTFTSLCAFREYCETLSNGVDPCRGLVCALNTAMLITSFETFMGHTDGMRLADVGVLAACSSLSVTALEQAAYYATLLHTVNARAKQRSELAFHYGLCMLVLMCTIGPTFISAFLLQGTLRLGVIACSSLLFFAHTPVWRFVDGRTSYTRLLVTTLASLTLAKAVFYTCCRPVEHAMNVV